VNRSLVGVVVVLVAKITIRAFVNDSFDVHIWNELFLVAESQSGCTTCIDLSLCHVEFVTLFS
jgi:hypothetical protein